MLYQEASSHQAIVKTVKHHDTVAVRSMIYLMYESLGILNCQRPVASSHGRKETHVVLGL